MRLIKTSMAICALAAATPAWAATDGTEGAISNGSFTMSVEVQGPPTPIVRVYGLTDVPLGQVPTGSDTNLSTGQLFCITNSTGGNIVFAIQQDNPLPLFALVNGTGDAGAIVQIDILPVGQTPIINMAKDASYQFNASPTCTDEDSSSALGMAIRANVPGAVVPGIYSAAFLLTVVPG